MNEHSFTRPAICVGVVDDHPLFTTPFASMLDTMNGIRATLVANSGKQTLDLLKTQDKVPDIILMDIDMPVMNGIETTRHITDLYPRIKVVALSGLNNEFVLLQMMDAGACAYLSKNLDTAALEEALHEVHRKGKYHADIFHLYEEKKLGSRQAPSKIKLKRREMDVLHCMRKGFTIEETASELCISVGLVKHYKAELNRKFMTTKSIIVVLEAIRRGLIAI